MDLSPRFLRRIHDIVRLPKPLPDYFGGLRLTQAGRPASLRDFNMRKGFFMHKPDKNRSSDGRLLSATPVKPSVPAASRARIRGRNDGFG